MWLCRSKHLAPLSDLTSDKNLFQWTEKHQKLFNAVKKIISHKTFLSYPDFDKLFNIHTDVSDLQLCAVISQNNKPIAFYSRKIDPAQTWYTTAEK